MSTEVQDESELTRVDAHPPLLAHIVSPNDHLRGYVLGEEIEAFCGVRFVPSRDPKKFPVCQPCKDALLREFKKFS